MPPKAPPLRSAILLALALVIASALPGRAWALPERLSLGPGVELTAATTTGVLIGTSHELVYGGSSTSYILSQLDWGLKPLGYYGLSLGLGGASGLYTSLSLRSGLAGRTGDIMDSDFLNGDGVKTNLSVSDNYTEDALLANFDLGWRIPINPQLALRAYGSLDYMHFKFTARDGYYQYGAYHAGPPAYYDPYQTASKYALFGSGIVYQQDFLALCLGAGADWAPRPGLGLSASLLFAPLVSCIALDNHVVRFLDFRDDMSKGWLLEPRLKASLALTKRSKVDVSLAYRLVQGLRGDEVITGTTGADSYYVPNGSGGYVLGADLAEGATAVSHNGAGAAFEALDIGLSLTMSL